MNVSFDISFRILFHISCIAHYAWRQYSIVFQAAAPATTKLGKEYIDRRRVLVL